MTDFPLYDVVNTCRVCGDTYPSKAFTPQGTDIRYGLCPTHLAEDDAKQRRLKQPPSRVTCKPERQDYRNRAAGERD